MPGAPNLLDCPHSVRAAIGDVLRVEEISEKSLEVIAPLLKLPPTGCSCHLGEAGPKLLLVVGRAPAGGCCEF
jgi:hypothetical protein